MNFGLFSMFTANFSLIATNSGKETAKECRFLLLLHWSSSSLKPKAPIHLFRQSMAPHWISSSDRFQNFLQPRGNGKVAGKHVRAVGFSAITLEE